MGHPNFTSMIHAETLGCAVPIVDFDAAVHSVFRRACNLQFASGELVTLLDSKFGILPQGIMLPLPDDFDFDSPGFRRGQHVTCRNGIVNIESLPFQIDLTAAIHWRADLQSHPISMRRPAVLRAWKVAHAEWQRTPTPTDAITTRAQPMIRSTLPLLSRAVSTHDLESARHHAARLIGCGIGLTPSGDDALIGFLAGLWSTSTSTSQQSFLTSFGEEITSLSSRTTDISRAYLIHAAQGQVSSVLENICHAIARGAPTDEVRHATRAALSVGHTSGADGVGGLLTVLRTLPTYSVKIVPLMGREISVSSEPGIRRSRSAGVFSVD